MLKRFLFPTTDKMPTSAQTAAVVKRLEAADVAERATLADLESDYGVRLVLAEEPVRNHQTLPRRRNPNSV